MSYKYKPLAADEFRLMTIEPSRETSSPIQCTLQNYRLPTASKDGTLQRFKGHNYIWPETQESFDVGSIFKKGAKYASYAASPNSGAPLDDEFLRWRYEWGDYIALSYVWGSASPGRQIVVNDQDFVVTPNLYDALLQLRESQRVRQGFKVWVDAICINQHDIAERSQQVARMRDVYASAWQVVIWLGPEADDSSLALTALWWFCRYARSTSLKETFYRQSRQVDARPLFIVWSVFRTPLRKQVYNALFCLLTRPYWQRMWILQEVAMARADAPVLCGNKCLVWKDVHDSARLIAHDEARLGRDIVDSVRPRILSTWTYEFARSRVIHERRWASERMWELLMELADMQQHQKQPPSSTLSHETLRPLILGREAAVTEEKDKVYGLLGIKEVAKRGKVVPDYNLSLQSVYQDFTTKLMSDGNLDILRLVSRSAGVIYDFWKFEDIPSALNHSSITPLVGPLLHSFRSSRKTLLVGTECTHRLPSWVVCYTCKPAPTAQLRGPYAASGADITSANEVFFTNEILTVKGFIFDTVCSLSSFNQDEVDTQYPVNATKSNGSAYGDFEATREALWRTVVGDTTSIGETVAPESYAWLLDRRIWDQGVAGAYTNGFGLHGIMSRNKRLEVCGYSLHELIFGTGTRSSHRDRLPRGQFFNPTALQCEALSWATNATAWRRLFGTENGRMGLGPAAAKVGDSIAILLGCSTPMVLRETGGGWQLVGECYVHGAMQGELLGGDELPVDIKLS